MIWLLSLLLYISLHYSSSADVVTMDDPRLIWSAGGPAPDPHAAGCGSKGTLWLAGESVTLIFNGTSLTVTVLGDDAGDNAQVYMDGQLSDTINTYAQVSVYITCDAIPYDVPPLADGQHNVTVVQSSLRADGGARRVFLATFAYTPSASASSTTTVSSSSTTISDSVTSPTPLPTTSSVPSPSPTVLPTPSSNHTGAIVGGVAGVVGAIAVGALIWFIIRRRRRARQDRETADLTGDSSPAESVPIVPWFQADAGAKISTSSATSPNGASSTPETIPLTRQTPSRSEQGNAPPPSTSMSSTSQASAKAREAGIVSPPASALPTSDPFGDTTSRSPEVATTMLYPRPIGEPSPTVSENRLSPAQRAAVRSLMNAGVTGEELAVLVNSMLGEGNLDPTQAAGWAASPPPTYNFEENPRTP